MSAEREAREAMASAVAMLVDGAVNQVPDVEQDRREKEYDRRVRAYCAAIETRERDEAMDVTREAEYRFNVKLHTALCGECPAFPGCGEACSTLTCDCCHDDASTDDLLADVAKLRARADRYRAALERYGEHLSGCLGATGDALICTCGLDAAREDA